MEIKVIHGSITDIESDSLIVNLFEGVASPGGATGVVDIALGGTISRIIAEGEITGKLNEFALIHTHGKIAAKRVIVAGLGKAKEFNLASVRKVSGAAVRYAREKGSQSVTTILHGAGIGGLDVKEAAAAVTEGTLIGLYRSDLYKKPADTRPEIKKIAIVEQDKAKIPNIETGVHKGTILGNAVNSARTLGNEPSNKMTPSILAERASDIAGKYGLDIDILDLQRMTDLKMGGIISVAQGSKQPPRLIVLKYKSNDATSTLALVGKGLTFDSGGISIKPSDGMQNMKYDMVGGAAVIHAMSAIAQMKPKINVIGIVPAAENMPGGSAFKPGDVITCMNEKTVEIITTDAEGRMILCDAITYAIREGTDYIVDIATLTGACVVALGFDYTGIMGNNREFTEKLKTAADKAGERVWELPLPDDYVDTLKSSIADITNAGGRWAGAIQGGLYLQEFVEGKPWVHMDIAGTADISTGTGPSGWEKYMDSGATGVGVRSLTHLAFEISE